MSDAAQGHDAECEIDNGAVGFDGLACLCADRAKASAATTLTLVRDGTLFGWGGTEIDFRTPDYSVWLTIKADSDVDAESVAAALEAAFGGDDAAK